MENVYCTVLSKLRLYQAIAFFMSMYEVMEDFKMYTLCVDDDTFNLLMKMKLKNIHLVHLDSLNDKKLLQIKKERQLNEYCWTLKPIFLEYLFDNFKAVDRITYVDADLFFWSNPSEIFLNQSDASILLSSGDVLIPLLPLPLIKILQDLMGNYNSGFISFKNDEISYSCIKWWKEKCLDSCINIPKAGQFGDQKYLDDVPMLFKKTKVINTPGVNIGHWNNSNHEFSIVNDKVMIDNDNLICYHFSGFRIIDKDVIVTIHELDRANIPFFYSIYKKILKDIIQIVSLVDKDFNGFAIEEDLVFKNDKKVGDES